MSCFAQGLFQTGSVKIDICHSGEETFDNKTIDTGISGTEFVCLCRVNCHSFQSIEQQILQSCHIRFFATDARNITTDTICRLLALITEHSHFFTPPVRLCVV